MFLEVKNLRFAFWDNKGKQILKDISFSLEKGKTLVIVGSSGSGKSTILRLISGILPEKDDLFSGQILVNNENPNKFLEKGKLSFMFQQPALFPNYSVKENIEIPLKIKNEKEDVKNIIDTVGLTQYQNYLPKQLSGGMKTRVALARSFVTKPELLLLDEPFSALDIAWKDALYHELKQLVNSFNTTVVLVTHDIEEALKLGDKIICLGIDGDIIFEKNNANEQNLFSLLEEKIIENHKLRKNEYEKIS